MFVGKFAQSYIQNIKIMHFSHPFYRKIPQNIPHLLLSHDAGFCPHYITAAALIKVANEIQPAESIVNVPPSLFLISKPHLTQRTHHPPWNATFFFLCFHWVSPSVWFYLVPWLEVPCILINSEFITSALTHPLRFTLSTPISTWKYYSHLKVNNAKSNLISTWTLPPN